MSIEHNIVLYCALQSLLLKFESTQNNRTINPDSGNESEAETDALRIPPRIIEVITNIIHPAVERLHMEEFIKASARNDSASKSSRLLRSLN